MLCTHMNSPKELTRVMMVVGRVLKDHRGQPECEQSLPRVSTTTRLHVSKSPFETAANVIIESRILPSKKQGTGGVPSAIHQSQAGVLRGEPNSELGCWG
jgi:hypothetical protein